MKNIVNFVAIRNIIVKSMCELDFGKAFGLAKRFFYDDNIAVNICLGKIKISPDGLIEDCIDPDMVNAMSMILNKYENVVLDELGYFYKLVCIEDSSFLSPEAISVIKSVGMTIVQSSSIDAEKRRVISDNTGKLYAYDAFIVSDDKIIFMSRFDSPVDKRFTPFFDNTNSFIQSVLSKGV